jgi:hypothetical protein
MSRLCRSCASRPAAIAPLRSAAIAPLRSAALVRRAPPLLPRCALPLLCPLRLCRYCPAALCRSCAAAHCALLHPCALPLLHPCAPPLLPRCAPPLLHRCALRAIAPLVGATTLTGGSYRRMPSTPFCNPLWVALPRHYLTLYFLLVHCGRAIPCAWRHKFVVNRVEARGTKRLCPDSDTPTIACRRYAFVVFRPHHYLTLYFLLFTRAKPYLLQIGCINTFLLNIIVLYYILLLSLRLLHKIRRRNSAFNVNS